MARVPSPTPGGFDLVCVERVGNGYKSSAGSVFVIYFSNNGGGERIHLPFPFHLSIIARDLDFPVTEGSCSSGGESSGYRGLHPSSDVLSQVGAVKLVHAVHDSGKKRPHGAVYIGFRDKKQSNAAAPEKTPETGGEFVLPGNSVRFPRDDCLERARWAFRSLLHFDKLRAGVRRASLSPVRKDSYNLVPILGSKGADLVELSLNG